MVRTGILSLCPVYFYPLSTAVGVIFEYIESINPVHLTETWKSKKKKKEEKKFNHFIILQKPEILKILKTNRRNIQLAHHIPLFWYFALLVMWRSLDTVAFSSDSIPAYEVDEGASQSGIRVRRLFPEVWLFNSITAGLVE